jgi:hypothetical protein
VADCTGVMKPSASLALVCPITHGNHALWLIRFLAYGSSYTAPSDARSHLTDTTHGTLAQQPMAIDGYVPSVPAMDGYESYGMQELQLGGASSYKAGWQ